MSDDGKNRLDQAKLIADHYQHTFEYTIEVWKQRNRLFIILLVVIGIGSIFVLEGPDGQRVWIGFLMQFYGGIENPKDITEYFMYLSSSNIMVFLQSILVTIVFFLMFNLYHRSIAVSRTYLYLGQLEDEIRVLLDTSADWVLFTREGDFYWQSRDTEKDYFSQKVAVLGQKLAKWVYISILFALLGAFIYVSLRADLSQIATNRGAVVPYIVLSIDSIIMLLTGFYFASYSFASVALDKKDKVAYPDLLRAENGAGDPPAVT